MHTALTKGWEIFNPSFIVCCSRKGGVTMNNYKVVVYVNGKRSEVTVSARTISDAKEIVKAQFAGAKLSFGSITKL